MWCRLHELLMQAMFWQFHCGLACLMLVAPQLAAQDRLNREQQQFFETKIRPVLVKNCYECHSAQADEVGGKLLLDTRNGIRQGGESGPAVVPGKPASSLLLIAMKHDDPKLIMPPADYGTKLPAQVIADFEAWIRGGALDPRGGGKNKASAGSEDAKQWWAWQPLKPVPVPDNATALATLSSWPRKDIDRFILEGLTASKLQPAADADRATLVRRLAIDLTGLPPSLEDLQRYALSEKPAPIEELVDRYMNSPQYGERMARRWLDVARYAESTGKDVNVALPHAWRYRDYVIDAFTNDMPYNQFIREQIAGDLIKKSKPSDAARQMIATGFLAIGPKGLGEQNPRQFAVDVADEQIDAVSQAFLAVTIACARCHDHKFDPISQRDYTAMAGIFLSTQTHFGTAGSVGGRNRSTTLALPGDAASASAEAPMAPGQLSQLKSRIEELEKQQREMLAERAAERRNGKAGTPPPGFALVQTQLNLLQTKLQAVNEDGSPKALAVGVKDKPPATPLNRMQQRFTQANQPRRGRDAQLMGIVDSPQLIRGEIDKPGEVVPRGLPEFLAGHAKAKIDTDESGRLQLANWIASERNPLTARVMVNRIWSWFFGQGLVKSVDNFGTTGDLPSNQALLDHLAQNFMKQRWSVKSLVREIVLSHSYAQASTHSEAAFLVDPDNELLWRANRRTLEAECLRDGMLAVSGSIQLERPTGSLIAKNGDGPIGGRRAVGVSEDAITSADDPHRSIYLPLPRNVLPDALELFDFADNAMVTGARSTTIVPSQALYWMNNPTVEKECRKIADQLLRQSTVATASLKDDQIASMFEQLTLKILARPALDDERQALVEFVKQKQSMKASQQTIWAGVARSLFASADYRFMK